MEATQLESTQDDVVQATQMDPESPESQPCLSPTREASQSFEQDAMGQECRAAAALPSSPRARSSGSCRIPV